MKNKKINIPTIIFTIFIFVGIFIMLYPVIINYINSKKSDEVISKYANQVKNLSNDKYITLIEEVEEYNKNLSSVSIIDAFTNPKENSNNDYMNLLNINSDGVMGYIKIPKINIEIPIYHGTSDEVLQKGVGHFESSSLPIGGESTHSILSAHRGLPSARLFTDLDQLKEGDLFYIYILDKILAYQVDKIETVDPSDVHNLTIEQGKDYVTLVTCTPYAINTHRLLVRGTRVEYNEEILKNIPIERKLTKADIILIISLIATFLILIIVIITVKKMDKKNEKYRSDIKNLKQKINDNIIFDNK